MNDHDRDFFRTAHVAVLLHLASQSRSSAPRRCLKSASYLDRQRPMAWSTIFALPTQSYARRLPAIGRQVARLKSANRALHSLQCHTCQPSK
jgi:hypothetical protein